MTMNDQGKHILIVEDEEHLAFGLKYNLEAEGYRATVVGDGTSALNIFNQADGEIDLVILDLMLPGMSGYAVCEKLRAAVNEVPILILSARTLTEDRTRGFDLGANQYLTKPFELDELLSRVKNLLTFTARNHAAAERETGMSQFQFGGARVDFKTHQVTVQGKPMRLTSLEMRLLRYFIENAGRVIPRAELLENVWLMPGNLATRAPDQFIRRLRKYFEPDPSHPRHFLTLRDAGYRFVAGDTRAEP